MPKSSKKRTTAKRLSATKRNKLRHVHTTLRAPFRDKQAEWKKDPKNQLHVARREASKQANVEFLASGIIPDDMDLEHITDDRPIRAALAKKDFRKFLEYGWRVLHPNRPFISNWHIDAICEHLQALHGLQIRDLLVTVPPGSGKPVDVDALVLMGDGSRKRLGDIVVGDIVITGSGLQTDVTAVHDQGSLEVVKITTNSGREVVAAPDHPFLTPEGWVAAGDLHVGQCLGCVVSPYTGAGNDRKLEEYRLAGYFVGDGCTAAAGAPAGRGICCQARITCFDPEEALDILHCADVLGFRVVGPKRRQQEFDFSCGVREWLRSSGLARKVSRTKRVPYWVFTGNDEQVANFVGAYFACDGSLTDPHRKQGRKRHLRITIGSVNHMLLQDTQHLLLRLGIQGKIRYKKAYLYGRIIDAWELGVAGMDEGAKFIARIPVYHDKRRRLGEWDPPRQRFDSVLLPDEIVSIETAGYKECRCLSLSGHDKSFTANDLVVHNSMLVSVYFPAWVWLDDPSLTFIYLSFAHELSARDSKRCRHLINSRWYRHNYGDLYRLIETRELKIVNDKTGFRLATSVKGAAAMGERGDYLCADDALLITKGRRVSDADRKEANRAYLESIGTRTRDSSTVRRLVIAQRIHDDDLPGSLIRQGGWCWLNLPMEFVSSRRCITSIGWKDPRTYDGELLFPQLFSREYCENKKKPEELSEYGYSALFQQDPIPEGGGIIKLDWIKDNQYSESLIDIYAKASRIIQSWDTAQKIGLGRSYTVGQVWVKHGALFYLIDQFRDQVEMPEIIRAIKRMKDKWQRTQEILVEDKSSGTDVVAMLRDQIPGIIPVPVSNEGSKDDRLYAVSYLFEAGNVKIPHAFVEKRDPPRIPWVPAYIDEVIRAPAGRTRDQIDSTSMALKRLASKGANPNAVPIGVGEGSGIIRSWDGMTIRTF